ncbi:MAG: hypothetical protein DRG83_08990 [Deltaproteobacteria bacterium]|nr:MAG: hypothetical protein DRG83_08990 [Deltaproteobacteria bacterium]
MCWFYGPMMGNFWFILPVLWSLFMIIVVVIFYQLFKRKDPGWTEGEIKSLKIEIRSLRNEIEKIKRFLGGAHGTD